MEEQEIDRHPQEQTNQTALRQRREQEPRIVTQLPGGALPLSVISSAHFSLALQQLLILLSNGLD